MIIASKACPPVDPSLTANLGVILFLYLGSLQPFLRADREILLRECSRVISDISSAKVINRFSRIIRLRGVP